jgi:hypothetical protein
MDNKNENSIFEHAFSFSKREKSEQLFMLLFCLKQYPLRIQCARRTKHRQQEHLITV